MFLTFLSFFIFLHECTNQLKFVFYLKVPATESFQKDVQFWFSPEDGSVEVVCMCAVDGIQVIDSGQLGSELTPGHLQDLVSDVALNDFDEMLHLVAVQLQLAELHGAAGAFHQSWGGQQSQGMTNATRPNSKCIVGEKEYLRVWHLYNEIPVMEVESLFRFSTFWWQKVLLSAHYDLLNIVLSPFLFFNLLFLTQIFHMSEKIKIYHKTQQ